MSVVIIVVMTTTAAATVRALARRGVDKELDL
jgi:hypothetical protein